MNLVPTLLYLRKAWKGYGGVLLALSALFSLVGFRHVLASVCFLSFALLHAFKLRKTHKGSTISLALSSSVAATLLTLWAKDTELGFVTVMAPMLALAWVGCFAPAPLVGIALMTSWVLELSFSHGTFRSFLFYAVGTALSAFFHLMYTRSISLLLQSASSKKDLELKAKRSMDAKMFRLVQVPTSLVSDEKLIDSGVDHIHDALFETIDLLRHALNAHSCVLLMSDGQKLHVTEASTDKELRVEPFDQGSGLLGAIFMRQVSMTIAESTHSLNTLPYYKDQQPLGSFVGIPLLETRDAISHPRGVLCIDRLDSQVPLTSLHEPILQKAGTRILSIIQNERLFLQLDRTKKEQGLLYQASQSLVEALSDEQVISAGLKSAKALCDYDFAAITKFDPLENKHTVLRAVGGSTELQGLEFKDNAYMVSMAVKNKHYLPYKGEFDAQQQLVFTRKHNANDMQSLLIFPLVVRENSIGTFIVGSKKAFAFTEGTRNVLQVLSHQFAVSLSNAQAVKRLEEMATTDGLTGCLNKRSFTQELESKIASASRFKKKLSLMVADIDHFKQVNDTYGHAVGDIVIKELGRLLMKAKRQTDLVSRFGGEEFCVLCEETDTDGAALLAERIRKELEKTVFHTERGVLKVTCSVGVATFPANAKNATELFEHADQALYTAKRSGRNRVSLFPKAA